MHERVLKSRSGFTAVEALIAMVLAAGIAAAATGILVTQSTLLDQQEKLSSARGVSRRAASMMLSELRMVEQQGGLVSVTADSITFNVPYAMGVICQNGGTYIFSQVPVPAYVTADADYSGYAYRALNGTYTYVSGTAQPSNGNNTDCTSQSVAVLSGGAVRSVAPGGSAPKGTPILLYQRVTYSLRPHASITGAKSLWRATTTRWNEELVGPLGSTSRFRFYVNDAAQAQNAVPGNLTTITGLELQLDALSERPDASGTRREVPYRTSVFFRNRL